jgi:hypothetical protein
MSLKIKNGEGGFRVTGCGFRVAASCQLPVAGFLVGLMLMGCGKPLPELVGVNLTDWKNDKDGCNGSRREMMDQLISQKDKILSLDEMDVTSLLGKPDQTELYKRSEKFYKYCFSDGPTCGTDSPPKTMTIRFNAMGLAKEVVVE